MKYLLLSTFLLLSICSFADKKKTNTKGKTSKTATTNADGVETATASTEFQTDETFKGKLQHTHVDAPLFPFTCKDWREQTVKHTDFEEFKLIVMLYNPDCGHCAEVAKKIRENLDAFPGTKLILMSGENTANAIPEFMKIIDIQPEDERVVFTLIDTKTTEAIFEYNGIPQVMVYGQDKLLRRVYYKGVDVEELTNLLK